MVSLLFEIGYEEFPPSFIVPTADFLLRSLSDRLKEHRLPFTSARHYSTSSRIALIIEGLPASQPDLKEKVTGAPRRIAVAEDGSLTKAGEAFLRKNWLTEYFFESTPKGEVIAGWREEEGAPLADVVVALLGEILEKIPFKKSMRWGNYDISFARPIRWILLMLDDVVIHSSFHGIPFSEHSFGHRFLSPNSLTVTPDTYVEILKNHFVIVEREQRKEMIKDAIVMTAERLLAPPLYDNAMMAEVVDSVEYPVCVSGKIPEKYMDLPSELIVKVLASDQHYFTFQKSDGTLLPEFLATLNNDPERKEPVIRGCEKVVSARLADAAFYFEEDLATPFDSFGEKLADMLYHKDLGSYADRAVRVKETALFAAKMWFELSDTEISNLKKAAFHAKNDLVSGVVYEFPDLQGVMGYYYAKRWNASEDVALTMKEHYLPRWLGDEFPSNRIAELVAIADKTETIVGGFMAGMKPTGSKDKFAIRRTALTLLSLLIKMNVPVDLVELFAFAGKQIIEYNGSLSYNPQDLADFISQRYDAVLSADTAVVKTVLSSGWSVPSDVAGRAAALDSVKNHEELVALSALFKRAGNILKKAGNRSKTEVVEHLLQEDAERRLFAIVSSVKQALATEADKVKQIEKITEIKPALDTFFDDVLVMDPDVRVRENRLSLLDTVVSLVKTTVGDISHLNM